MGYFLKKKNSENLCEGVPWDFHCSKKRTGCMRQREERGILYWRGLLHWTATFSGMCQEGTDKEIPKNFGPSNGECVTIRRPGGNNSLLANRGELHAVFQDCSPGCCTCEALGKKGLKQKDWWRGNSFPKVTLKLGTQKMLMWENTISYGYCCSSYGYCCCACFEENSCRHVRTSFVVVGQAASPCPCCQLGWA